MLHDEERKKRRKVPVRMSENWNPQLLLWLLPQIAASQVPVTNEANHGEFKSDPTAQGRGLYALSCALAVEQTWSHHVFKDGERLQSACEPYSFIDEHSTSLFYCKATNSKFQSVFKTAVE